MTWKTTLGTHRLNLPLNPLPDAVANVANPNRLNLPDVEDAEANMANPNVAGVVEEEVAVVMAVDVDVDKALNNGETLF